MNCQYPAVGRMFLSLLRGSRNQLNIVKLYCFMYLAHLLHIIYISIINRQYAVNLSYAKHCIGKTLCKNNIKSCIKSCVTVYILKVVFKTSFFVFLEITETLCFLPKFVQLNMVQLKHNDFSIIVSFWRISNLFR